MAKTLAHGRSAIIYHHNTRFRGSHDLEVDLWLNELRHAIAMRANAFSCRTFFVVNPAVRFERKMADSAVRKFALMAPNFMLVL